MTIFLSSGSPRRAELLDQILVPYQVISAAIDETRQPGETPLPYVERLAREKAMAGFRAIGGAGVARAPATTAETPTVVIGADTVVVVDGDVFGKPRDEQDATAQLRTLSGRAHEVFTAVAVVRALEDPGSPPICEARVSRSRVWFRTLTDAEIAAYWASGEPADKAGSYAIQGIAARYITRIEGSYSAVMGLPVHETSELLARAGALPA